MVRELPPLLMEFYQLRTFLTVAEEAHLTRAAEKLFTSQPAVSAHIRALEEELGVKLFERTTKGMTLTSAGNALQEEARRIVEATRQFKQQAEALRTIVAGELVFGLNNQPDILRLVPILHRLTSAHPHLRYDMVSGSSGVILQGIDEGSISIGFFEGACTNARIAYDVLGQIDLCLLAPAAWKKELRVPDWKALEERPWIFVSPMCSYYRIIEHICREQGLEIQPRFRANECMTAVQLVADGLGLTICSRAQIALYPEREKLFILPHFHASVPLSLGYLSARAEDPVVRAVREAVREVWSDASAEPAENVTFSLGPVRRPRARFDRRSRGKETRS
ncbi:MAG: LysR family transcriptional regulator [Chthoniobacteraceae bacterium]|nr:LysR family transcriptional regulator [Chthoniobacteraceae bacterium]